MGLRCRSRATVRGRRGRSESASCSDGRRPPADRRPVHSVIALQQMESPLLTVAKYYSVVLGGLVAEWLACWTQAQKGPGSYRSRDAVG